MTGGVWHATVFSNRGPGAEEEDETTATSMTYSNRQTCGEEKKERKE